MIAAVGLQASQLAENGVVFRFQPSVTDSRGARRVAPLRQGQCGQMMAGLPPMKNRAVGLSGSRRVVMRCDEVRGRCRRGVL